MSEINIPEWVTNRDKSLDTNICPECLHMYQIHIAYPHAGGCHDCLCTRTYQSLISSVRKQTIGMTLTERITELTAERDKYRDACERAETILRRCMDAWCGGAEDDGLMDDIQTLGNQIRRLLHPVGESEVIEL